MEQDVEPSAVGSEVVVSWNVAASLDGPDAEEASSAHLTRVELGEDGDFSLQLTGQFDSDGLLCDPYWLPPSPSSSSRVASMAAGDTVHDQWDTLGGLREPADELGEPMEEPEEATSDHARGAAGARDPQTQLRQRISKLSRQISRLYGEVVQDLPPAAREVWDELYRLFREKMEVEDDLTDEDQIEIERYVFQQLPTESMGEKIYNIYRCLHLESERDNCQRRLVA